MKLHIIIIGYETTFIHPPFKKAEPSFLKGGFMGGKGGPPLNAGYKFVKYTLARKFINLIL